MRTPKDLKRRTELRRSRKRLGQLGQQRVPRTDAEGELRKLVSRHLQAQAPFGIDDDVMLAVNDMIDAHVISIESEMRHLSAKDDVELGKLQASLDGLAMQYGLDSGHRSTEIAELEYQKGSSIRVIEDRDTPQPAGPGGVEEEGYQHGNVGELAGRGFWGLIVLYLVLVLAMLADVITFNQVVQRLLNEANHAVLPLVLALTATTTWVAHHAGEAFARARRSRKRLRKCLDGWALSLVWFALGTGAFFFRLIAPAAVAANSNDSFVTGDSAPTSDGSPALSAVMLLLLYLVTGAIAMTAGYHRPRPEVAQARRAGRRLRRSRPRLGVVMRDVTEARALSGQIAKLREGRRQQYEQEIQRCRTAADRVRTEAVVLGRRLRHRAENSWRRRLRNIRPAAVDPARPDPIDTEPPTEPSDEPASDPRDETEPDEPEQHEPDQHQPEPDQTGPGRAK
jgi:hypothetical protein